MSDLFGNHIVGFPTRRLKKVHILPLSGRLSCSIMLAGKIGWLNSCPKVLSKLTSLSNAGVNGTGFFMEPHCTSVDRDMLAGFFSFNDHLRWATSCWKMNSGESNLPDPVGKVLDLWVSRSSSGSEFSSKNNGLNK